MCEILTVIERYVDFVAPYVVLSIIPLGLIALIVRIRAPLLTKED